MLSQMRQAGYDAVSLTVAYDPEDTMTAIRRISHWRKFVRENDDRFLLLTAADDAERAKAEGKLAIGVIAFPAIHRQHSPWQHRMGQFPVQGAKRLYLLICHLI